MAVASTWAHECRMRSNSVNFARSSGVLRSLGSWFWSGIDEKVLTADARRWTQISCGGGGAAASRRAIGANDALSRQPMHWRFPICVHLRPSAVVKAILAVASTWAQECRMRSNSVNFARSSGVLRSLGSWFWSGIDEKVLTADARRWTQISCGGGGAAASRRAIGANDALSRQPMHWRFPICVHLRPSAVVKAILAVASTWAQECRMRSSSVNFARSSGVLRSLGSWFWSGIDEKVLTADARGWTQISCGGGGAAASRRAIGANDALSRQPMHWRFPICVHLRPSAVVKATLAVASTWAQECRMRSSSVIFARSSGVLRSLGSWFSSGVDEKVLTADARRWTQISCGGGAAASRRATGANGALSRQPMQLR